jgi:hypothetical protein
MILRFGRKLAFLLMMLLGGCRPHARNSVTVPPRQSGPAPTQSRKQPDVPGQHDAIAADGTQDSPEVLRTKVLESIATPTAWDADSPIGADCNPNYRPCVPFDSDVDCEGGSGNGPSYVRGPIHVVGSDPYDLDRDGNGVGCE